MFQVSYFGSKAHRARWTSVGQFVLVIGTIIFVLPQFISDVYDPKAPSEDQDPGVCDLHMTYNRTCVPEENNYSKRRRFLPMFIIGRLLHGLGAVPLYTIAVTFLDDCVSNETFSLYIGKFFCSVLSISIKQHF